jgi:hypothetical protein
LEEVYPGRSAKLLWDDAMKITNFDEVNQFVNLIIVKVGKL